MSTHTRASAAESRPPTERRMRVVAHRGKSAAGLPENTLPAFEAAVQEGAWGIETDLHVSSDGVVMISHDVQLKPRFGVEGKLTEWTYDRLKELRTVQAPHVEMPSFAELLEMMRRPEYRHIVVFLDVKVTVTKNVDELVKAISETIAASGNVVSEWKGRLFLGCWWPSTFPIFEKYLPEFGICLLAPSMALAYELLSYPEVPYFHMHYTYLADAAGKKFMKEARAHGKQVFMWGSDTELWKIWAAREPDLDGIMTDDPKKFSRMLDKHSPDEGPMPLSLKIWLVIFIYHLLGHIIFPLYNGINWRRNLAPPRGSKEKKLL